MPKIFIVGAAKCGTTSLWAYLRQHPVLASSTEMKNKELGFFCNLFGTNDETYYLSQFGAEKGVTNLECCTSYLTSPESPFLIKESVPEAKIIIILRNPVERAFSLYKWMVANGFERSGSFEKALSREAERKKSQWFRKYNNQYFYNYLYRESGEYSKQIERYYHVFGKHNVHIILYDDFKKNAELELKKVIEFLKLPDFSFSLLKKHNVGRFVHSPAFQFYSRFVFIKLFSKTFLTRKLGSVLYRVFSRINNSKKKVAISSTTRKKLVDNYLGEYNRIEKLLNVPVTEIWG